MRPRSQVKTNHNEENIRQFSEKDIESFLKDDKLSLEDTKKFSKLLERKSRPKK